MNLQAMKDRAAMLRSKLDNIDVYVQTMEKEIGEFLGKPTVTAGAIKATAIAAAPVTRKARRKAKRVVKKPIVATAAKPVRHVATKKQIAVSPATKRKPNLAAMKAGRIKANAAKLKASVPASAPVSSAGIDSDFDALN